MLKEYVYILEIVRDILQKLIHDSRNICICLRLNAHRIGILDNLLDLRKLHQHLISASTWIKESIIYSKFNNFCVLQQKLPFTEHLKIKPLTCFKYQINRTFVLTERTLRELHYIFFYKQLVYKQLYSILQND